MQWQALIYIKTKSVPSRAARYFISVALWYMHFLLVLGRFRDWCCLIHDILFSLASLLQPLIHVYVYLTNNNPNFKALGFLKPKFWPEPPFLICYDTAEPLEFPFFAITNLQVEHSFLKKITLILPPALTLSQHNIFLRHCKYLDMYTIRAETGCFTLSIVCWLSQDILSHRGSSWQRHAIGSGRPVSIKPIYTSDSRTFSVC